MNLGKLDLLRESWKTLANRIEEIISGQISFCSPPPQVEELAQHFAGILVKKMMDSRKVLEEQISQTKDGIEDSAEVSCPELQGENEQASSETHWEEADLDSMTHSRSRTVGGEALGHYAFGQLRFCQMLKKMGFSETQADLAELLIIGRLIHPASERATGTWAKNISALGELMGTDFTHLSNNALYRASDLLIRHRDEIEKALSGREKKMFGLEEKVILYDLTNTYFEGVMKGCEKAKHGRSKEKRSDCPLVTLALVIDEEGFPKMSKTYPGSVSEPGTLKEILEDLKGGADRQPTLFERRPTIVIDAGIATDSNIELIKEYQCNYVCVSRVRPGDVNTDDLTCLERKSGKVHLKKFDGDDEVLVYCKSEGRLAKEEAMKTQFVNRFEEGLKLLENSIKNPRGRKDYDGIMTRLGRLLQKYSTVARFYTVDVERDQETGKATSISWKLSDEKGLERRYSGAYYVRTNRGDLEAEEIWQLYLTLLEVESAFRSLKSELGLRPNFHQKDARIDGHIFISVLAYHLLAVIQRKLRQNGIHHRWETIRNLMSTQTRVTASITTKTNGRVHLRQTVDAEPFQRRIYKALGISSKPLRIKKVRI
ncbi:MAG: IS1634 family transposase [Thermodesulfobacteriota bacterium]|nr:IS1634 family transposase [Thermodesulfobacteriota bacterium]